jgi:hypothetical protein
MENDPIVNEIRLTREKIFKECDEDLNKLIDFLKEQEKNDSDRLVSSEEIMKKKHIETTI